MTLSTLTLVVLGDIYIGSEAYLETEAYRDCK